MKKVLIVDDEEIIRFSFGSILTEAGYDVIKAQDITDAKSFLNLNKFSVAIIDRLLGSDDGLELVKYINTIQPCCKTIIVSAYPTFQSASKGFRLNLFDYLKKPVKKRELCKIVDNAANIYRKKRLKQQRIKQFESCIIKNL